MTDARTGDSGSDSVAHGTENYVQVPQTVDWSVRVSTVLLQEVVRVEVGNEISRVKSEMGEILAVPEKRATHGPTCHS